MEWYEEEVRAMEQARTIEAANRPVAFYGSSSIRLWENPAADLGEPSIVNLGFGGSTLAACARYFGRLVVPLRPRSLVVYAGDNDLGDGRSAQEVFGSFRDLAGQVAERLGPIPFGFLSIKPSPARWHLNGAIVSANAMIEAEIRSRPDSRYIDIYRAMLGPNGRPRPELYAEDGLHLSPAGYQVWTSRILAQRGGIF